MHAMSESGYASLGPTLLARKGGAKPAMRPQLPVLGDAGDAAKLADAQLEDLGWNDMGDDDGTDPQVVVSIDPETPSTSSPPAASPIVRRQQRRLEERLLADAVMNGPEDAEPEYPEESNDDWADHETVSAPVHTYEAEEVSEPEPVAVLAARTIPVREAAPAMAGRRAAFTLRLDPDRHLKLRLAATMRGVSAQALVTDALDALLADFEELDTIAAHLQRH
jgi:hypothetical protein